MNAPGCKDGSRTTIHASFGECAYEDYDLVVAGREPRVSSGGPVQSGPADHRKDELLLTDYRRSDLGMVSDVGCVLQFWINRESLAARNFDTVQATMDCD